MTEIVSTAGSTGVLPSAVQALAGHGTPRVDRRANAPA
jgi:hypothetical protein